MVSPPAWPSSPEQRAGSFARRPGGLLRRGGGAILFGILALARPQLGLVVFLGLFAVYATRDGAAAIAALLRLGPGLWRWRLGLAGAASLLAAAGVVLAPDLGGAARLAFVGLWAVLRGLIGIADGLAAERGSAQAWGRFSGAAVPLGFGLMLLARLDVGPAALIGLVASWAVVLGLLMVWLGLELRRRDRSPAP